MKHLKSGASTSKLRESAITWKPAPKSTWPQRVEALNACGEVLERTGREREALAMFKETAGLRLALNVSS